MLLSLKINKIQILLFSFILTILIFIINKKSINFENSQNLSFNLRNLILTEEVDERCLKTNKDFLKKYNYTSTDLNLEKESLNEYHIALINILGYKNYKKIKDYLLRIIIFIIIANIDIIIIFIWIGLWSYYCCIKRDKTTSNVFSKCFILLFWFLCIIAIVFCVFGLFLIPCFYNSINGVICSFYKLIFHFIEGTQNDFQPSNWKGVEGLKFLLNSYNQNNDIMQNNISSIYENEENLNVKEKQLLEIYNNYINNTHYENDTIFMSDLYEAEQNIENISTIFTEIKENKLDNLEKKMEYFDKYCKLGLYIMFSAFLCFSFFELLSITIYYICNCNWVKIIFHFFWNIEFLFIIVTILIGVGFGIIGVVSKDVSAILKYAKSNNNLNSNKTIIFDFNENYKEYFDICFNGNGDLSELAFSSNASFGESNKDDYINFEKFDKEYSTNKENEKLSNEFEILYKAMKNMKELYDDLKGDNLKRIFDCKFMKYDFNIIITELENSISIKFVLFSLIIIVIDLIEIMAIIFGIIIVKYYKGENILESKENKGNLVKIKQKYNTQSMDSSSDNLKNQIKIRN